MLKYNAYYDIHWKSTCIQSFAIKSLISCNCVFMCCILCIMTYESLPISIVVHVVSNRHNIKKCLQFWWFSFSGSLWEIFRKEWRLYNTFHGCSNNVFSNDQVLRWNIWKCIWGHKRSHQGTTSKNEVHVMKS